MFMQVIRLSCNQLTIEKSDFSEPNLVHASALLVLLQQNNDSLYLQLTVAAVIRGVYIDWNTLICVVAVIGGVCTGWY
jgi:hypothetical protein